MKDLSSFNVWQLFLLVKCPTLLTCRILKGLFQHQWVEEALRHPSCWCLLLWPSPHLYPHLCVWDQPGAMFYFRIMLSKCLAGCLRIFDEVNQGNLNLSDQHEPKSTIFALLNSKSWSMSKFGVGEMDNCRLKGHIVSLKLQFCLLLAVLRKDVVIM